MKNVLKLSEAELKVGQKSSWHDQYRNSAWIFVGGLPYDLSEGDIICVFSQFGEIVNINLVRDKATGKQKGFCFICYEDQRSTVLSVDNLNGIKVQRRNAFIAIQSLNCLPLSQILGKTIRVDHVNDYKPPKEHDDMDEVTRKLQTEGCAPQPQIPVEHIKREATADTVVGGVRLPQRLPIGSSKGATAEQHKSRRERRNSSDNDDDSDDRKSKKVR